MSKKRNKNICLLKRDACQHCVALKSSKLRSFYVALINNNRWILIFSHLLANVPPRPKAGKRTPSQIWGARTDIENNLETSPHLYTSEGGGYPEWGRVFIGSDMDDLRFAFFYFFTLHSISKPNAVKCLHYSRTSGFRRMI